MKFTDELTLLLKARYPVIFINTIEEDRVEYVIRKYIKTSLNRSIYSWDFVDGYTNNPNNEGFAKRNPLQALELIERLTSETPAIFLLKDFNRFLTDISISRKLKNIGRILKLQPKTIIIIGSDFNIPKELQDLITIIQFQLPNQAEIIQELTRLINSLNIKIDSELFENLAQTCQGLSLERIRRVLSKIIATHKTIDKNSISILLSEKKQIISQTEILEYCSVNNKIVNIGGIKILKEWLKKRKTSFSIQAANYGLPTPRGLLLVGIQGTGKSLTAKAIAHSWSMPLLRLDIGRLFAGLVGASEAKARETIQYAESMAPCVLWIDEIDKGFGGDARSDGGTSQRVLANLLTWMAEKKSAVFVVATANGIDRMPGELLRKGRFDEIFLLDLPTLQERFKILELHLKQRRPNLILPIDTVASRTEGFSGAELEQTVIEAMHHAFSERRELLETDLILASTQLIPLSKTAKEQLHFLKDWASSGRARPASLRIN